MKELKDLIKPPFSHCGTGCGHVTAKVITSKGEESFTRLLDIRGWGYFQNFENGAALQDAFKDWIVEALNEKVEREWEERKRWVDIIGDSSSYNYYQCPACMISRAKISNYCSNCGLRLDPPEEAKDDGRN